MTITRLFRRGSFALVVLVAAGTGAISLGSVVRAQTPGSSATPQAAARSAASTTSGNNTARASAPKIDANMLQLMRGILYPSSNVIFAAQDDLSNQPAAPDPSVSPNPLTSTYGGWLAVENAGLALSEAATLVALPGRLCANGKPAPVQRADWVKATEGLRQAGLAVYKAAQMKSTDAIVDVSGMVSDACASCHDVYREKKGGTKDRCLP